MFGRFCHFHALNVACLVPGDSENGNLAPVTLSLTEARAGRGVQDSPGRASDSPCSGGCGRIRKPDQASCGNWRMISQKDKSFSAPGPG